MKDSKHIVTVSKFLSLILRHSPATIKLKLDDNGWADIDELLAGAASHGKPFNRKLLEQVVADNDKKRFTISDDGKRIRANQGHSVKGVDLELPPVTPPEVLYHGTASRFAASIRDKGLIPGSRHHVHLSADSATAVNVGQRHGVPVVLAVQARALHEQGQPFYLSANGVWLTGPVDKRFIAFP
ncbi:RNA 2'-phosphotransferase [Massilia atriviolacea]|uniref:Probable RNA 2'-phosphotransferase n=1 Tax=Massilia atriviolacea TaxID=2495579 RepID=A0A430HFG3_9BURK|nr:RNA 2'-phosphotransferase [Massilia atriviolacea]RSZ56246.1 RNA 2'-phosphotransferase [Massilia atriviolacea]